MRSKSCYADNSVLKQIAERTKKYKNGISQVIYCIDTDDIFVEPMYKNDWLFGSFLPTETTEEPFK